MSIKFITRRLFSETVKDYQIRLTSTSDNATALNETYEYMEWNIQRSMAKAYHLVVHYERWHLTS